jgi:probable rRNA maturation factor
VSIDLDLAVDARGLPAEREFRQWVAAAIGERRPVAEVSLRIVASQEMRELNRTWRGIDKPTNVLAFPADVAPEVGLPLIGDVVLCRDVVLDEADAQHKPASAHWAHLTVHGTLHLLGYDHGNAEEAEAMEAIERHVLGELGYPDPYASDSVGVIDRE